jgi:hypothetical protein
MKQKVIIIVGMHRSGTSALTRVLNLLGVELGPDLLGAFPSNEKGHWESLNIIRAHQDILESLDSCWDDIGPLPDGWVERIIDSCSVQAILSYIRRNFADSRIWAVKDPRLGRLLPLWKKILVHLDCEPFYVNIIRHPHEVALSLHKRDNMPLGKGGLLWLNHVLSAQKHTEGCKRAFLTYESLLNDWRRTIGSLEEQLGFSFPLQTGQTARQIESFLDPALRHHVASSGNRGPIHCLPNYVKETYLILMNGIRDGVYDFAESLRPMEESFTRDLNRFPYDEFIRLNRQVINWKGRSNTGFSVFYESRLLIDIGNGFDKTLYSVIDEPCDKSSLIFPLHEYSPIKALRFLPDMAPCVVRIGEARIVTAARESIPVGLSTHNGVLETDSKYYFATQEPFIDLNLELVNEPVECLEITMNYITIGYEALLECIDAWRGVAQILKAQKMSQKFKMWSLNKNIHELTKTIDFNEECIVRLEQSIETGKSEMEKLIKFSEDQRNQIHALSTTIQKIHNSIIWKLTLPAIRLFNLLRQGWRSSSFD